MDYDVIKALQSPTNREVLHVIARRMRAQLKDLIGGPLRRERAIESINALKSANLIKESPSPVPDLSTYFVTAAGLQADREL